MGKPFYHYFIYPENFLWIDATFGNNLNLNCDSCCKEVDMGFNFEFYGEVYNKIYVCDDGYLSFSPSTHFESTNQILVQYQDTIFGSSYDNGQTATAGIENRTSIRRPEKKLISRPIDK